MEFNCPKRVRSPKKEKIDWEAIHKAYMKKEIDFILERLPERLKEFEALLKPSSMKIYKKIIVRMTTYNCEPHIYRFMSEKNPRDEYFCTKDQWDSVIVPKLREQGFTVSEKYPGEFTIN